MAITFDKRAVVPADVLVTVIDGEWAILNLKTESYFGLDVIGGRMWTVVTAADSIQAGYESLKQEFAVDPEELRRDLGAILEKLLDHGLLELQ